MTGLSLRSWIGFALFGCFSCLVACESCEEKSNIPSLQLPFADNFDRPTLGSSWFTERPGRWKIQYDTKTQTGQLCVWQARNMPLFLRGKLPRNVVIEFDAWAKQGEGDVKIELFTDGKYHATGYVLIHGGWNNSWSIIDRLDEHNPNCRAHEAHQKTNCRRVMRGGPVAQKRYHWKVVRFGDTVEWFLDGKLYLRYPDPMPLEGSAHQFFAFSNWIAHVCFDNLQIKEYVPTPAQQIPQEHQGTPRPTETSPGVPSAPLPSTANNHHLQPQLPMPPKHTIPRTNSFPQPHVLQLHPANREQHKLRLYQPQILQRSQQLRTQGTMDRKILQIQTRSTTPK